MVIWNDFKIFGLNFQKIFIEKYESRKRFEEEFEEFRKITESLINSAERLGLLDKEKIKEEKRKQKSWDQLYSRTNYIPDIKKFIL